MGQMSRPVWGKTHCGEEAGVHNLGEEAQGDVRIKRMRAADLCVAVYLR